MVLEKGTGKPQDAHLQVLSRGCGVVLANETENKQTFSGEICLLTFEPAEMSK